MPVGATLPVACSAISATVAVAVVAAIASVDMEAATAMMATAMPDVAMAMPDVAMAAAMVEAAVGLTAIPAAVSTHQPERCGNQLAVGLAVVPCARRAAMRSVATGIDRKVQAGGGGPLPGAIGQ